MSIKTKETVVLMSILLGVSVSAWAQPHDPYEPYNRFMYGINDGVDRTVLVPIARGYQKVMPKPVQTGVTNVFDNLRDVVSFGSNVLRLDAEKASTDLVRVGINTTFGLGGLINIADAAQMPNNKNSLGDTFASWGWKNSNYLVYPLLGPSTVRDAVADTVVRAYSVEQALIDSEGWGYAVTALKGVDQRAKLLVYTDGLDMAAVDRYAYTREVFMSMRAKQVNGVYGGAVTEDIDIDDLVPAGTSEQEDSSHLQLNGMELEVLPMVAEQTQLQAVHDVVIEPIDSIVSPSLVGQLELNVADVAI